MILVCKSSQFTGIVKLCSHVLEVGHAPGSKVGFTLMTVLPGSTMREDTVKSRKSSNWSVVMEPMLFLKDS